MLESLVVSSAVVVGMAGCASLVAPEGRSAPWTRRVIRVGAAWVGCVVLMQIAAALLAPSTLPGAEPFSTESVRLTLAHWLRGAFLVLALVSGRSFVSWCRSGDGRRADGEGSDAAA